MSLQLLLQHASTSAPLHLVREKDGLHRRKEGRGEVLVISAELEEVGLLLFHLPLLLIS